MRIDELIIENFKGFENTTLRFPSSFSLIIGTNGTGKTSALEALSVAAGSWFLGIRGYERARHIRSEEVRLAARKYQGEIRFEACYPVRVSAAGLVGAGNDQAHAQWSRTLASSSGRTTYGAAVNVRDAARRAEDMARQGESHTLPVISYYGTGRLWLEPRQASLVKTERRLASSRRLSRLEGYRNSIDPRLSVRDLITWIARQSWVGYQQGKEPEVFRAVKKAVLGCVEDAENLYFDPGRGEVVVVMREHGAQPFANLSDGQRCMLALVGDIAQKAAKLNPHLGRRVLDESPGLVLIDELDLHLHPRWQRRVIEDLRRTFPQMQFICTTHSPFLVQSLRDASELVMLTGQPVNGLGNRSIDDIARDVMGVEQPQVSQRYAQATQVARDYLEELHASKATPEDKVASLSAKLADPTSPFAENPALQAFLEMERVAKLGR